MMHIACAADAAYLPHCAAMLHSVLVRHDPAQVQVHFMHDDALPAEEITRLADWVKATGAGWHALHLDTAAQARFPDNRRFGRVAWYRVLLPELLPKLDRVLYLDADTIVMDSLDELWECDISHDLAAVICNPLYPFMNDAFMQTLGVGQAEYFNSGVLLMNLEAMRHEKTVSRLLDYAAEQGLKQEWPDQNALNVILKGRCQYLQPRWNAQNTLFDLTASQLPFDAEAVKLARKAPAIVHYIGPYKPWHYRCKHPLRQAYWQHLRQTPWQGKAMEGITLKNRLLRLLPEQFGWRLEAWLGRMRRFGSGARVADNNGAGES